MNYLRLLQLRRHPDGGVGGGAPGDSAPSADPPPAADPDKPAEGKPGAPIDFGALLKDKGFQSELGRYVNKALDTARSNWEQEAQGRIDAARTEGEKLAKLSAEERAKAEAKKQADAMAAREAKLLAGEFRASAVLEMGEKKLPASLCKVLDYIDAKYHGDENARQAVVDALEAAHREGVQAGVDERMRGKEPPKDGGGTPARNPWALGQINLTEQGRILREDPKKAAEMKAAAGLNKYD